MGNKRFEKMPRDILGSLGIWAYSVGHFMNDLVG
jgi:hypothetical protein